MSNKHDFVFEPLVFDHPRTPPRSRLYCLEPIGIGTPLTESFLSYLARLAHAHCIGPWTLIREEILPVTKEVHLTSSLRGGLWVQAQVLNGVGIRARRWVAAVGQLASRQDLHWLTMLPWKHIISRFELVRSERAWCPQCLRDWRVSSRAVYEPLLWALKCVSACPIHEEPLQSRCPHGDCGHRLPTLHARLLPGRCSRCFRWLDEHPEESRPRHWGHSQMDWAQAVWVAKAVGELLGAAPTLHVLLGRDRLAQVMRALCQTVTQGNGSTMVRLQSLIVNGWMRGRGRPQLNSLVQLCRYIGTTPLGLLGDGGHTPARSEVCLTESLSPPNAGGRRWTPFPIETVKAALETVLADRQSSAPSLSQVAKKLGYRPDNLRGRFPELCRVISARYRQDRADRAKKRLKALKADVRLATRTLVQQGINPSSCQVERYLMKLGIFRNPKLRDTWRMTLKELSVTPVVRRGN